MVLKTIDLVIESQSTGAFQSIAELMTTYKHIMGSDKSQKMAQAMGAGNIEKTLQQISQELEEMKREQAGGI